jgi:flotillin
MYYLENLMIFLANAAWPLIITLGILIAILMVIRVIVPPEYADVVIQGKRRKIYCSDININKTKKAIYYKIPKWIPVIGMYVKRIPLKVIEIQVKDYETFAQRNARFICDVSVYGKVNDPEIAAQRWPGNTVQGFQEGIKEIIVAAIRNTTTKFPVEDVIAKKQEIADGIQQSLEEDMKVYGFDVTNVAVVGISDPPEGVTTVIRDISAKMESEINSESRKQIAIKQKDAEIVEADSREKSEVRKKMAEQKIGEAEQEKQKAIYITQQQAQEEAMKVERIKNVKAAEIQKEAIIVEAEGKKLSVIRVKEGEAEGIAKVGGAEAQIIKAKGLAEAEAKEKMAQALNKFNEAAKIIRDIEKDEKVGLAGMNALSQADLKLISTGEVKSFVDIFSGKGGANIGAMFETIKNTNPEGLKQIKNVIDKFLEDKKKKPEKK